MRTIKFRGKRIDNGLWMYGFVLHCDRYTDIWSAEGRFDRREVDPETVGQFTGLIDKNGQEIYEGDILALAGVETERLEVRFVRGVFAFLWGGNLEEEAPIDQPTHCCVEIVGNIHDNPGLLKGGQV